MVGPLIPGPHLIPLAATVSAWMTTHAATVAEFTRPIPLLALLMPALILAGMLREGPTHRHARVG